MALKNLIPVLFLAFTGTFYSQSKINESKTSFSEKFPDESCYSLKETDTYSFSLNKQNLEVVENFRSFLYTNDYSYTKYNTVYYDDYSEVTKVKYSVNGAMFSNVKVVYANYESADIFHDDLKICAYAMDMEKNKNYESYYTKTYKNARFFTRVYFHEKYPIHEKTIQFSIPDWVNVEIKPVNFEGYKVVKTETVSTSSKIKTVTYTIENTISIPNERNAPGIAKYLPHLLVFVKSFNKGKFSETFFTNHTDVYKWNKTLVDETKNNADELRPVLNSIVKGETDSLKMIEKVFYWVQDNIRYIAFEDGIMGYKPATANKVCNLLYGDCKGMANLTSSFLKMLGFDARLTWIGTDAIPYDNDLPTLAVYNHMICTVLFRGKKYYLDATEDYIPLDDYAERIQSRPCMIENGNSYIVSKIPDLGFERNFQSENYTVVIENDLLKGKSENTYKGETKTRFLRGFNETQTIKKENALNSYLASDNADLTVKNIVTSDLSERSTPLKINFDFILTNSVLKSSLNELVVLLNKDRDLASLYFDSTRVCDYVFRTRYNMNYSCALEIPPGYKASKLPQPLNIDNEVFSFNFSYAVKDGKVNLIKTIKVKKGMIARADFKTWNLAIERVKNFYNSPVILSKA